ncbi:DMT family transporter [Roseovarius sp. EL26]|uniref:DMT family transporter n=1 Tax=Roseovarius sp. EL26 TaxID=2126672 RepID=UPI000EA31764|nr:DMT family transporter [Roseovarius sp. EL26]
MTRDYTIGMVMLIAIAALWGLGFVFQAKGMDHLGPFTFNAIRFAMGALSIVPVIVIFSDKKLKTDTLVMIKGGALAGVFMFFGITLQQYGLLYTTAGKSAFITGLYIIFVPLIGLFLGQRFGAKVWFAAVLAFTGLYLLSETTGLAIGKGELLTVICALFWAGVVIINGRYAGQVDGPKYAFVQFLVVVGLSLPFALILEHHDLSDIWAAREALLFVGILNTGVAMTVQVLAQKRVPPMQAALVMSLETVFGAFGGWLLLNEMFTNQMLLGCALMLAGLVLAQLPGRRERKPIRWFFRRRNTAIEIDKS